VKLKSLIHLRGRRLRSRRLQGLVAVTTTVVGLAGFAVAQASPALADPTQSYVSVGSDTIQDVSNQFAIDVAGNQLGSYNAVNPVTGAAHELITPAKASNGANCSFTRPNGSGEGVNALRYSINPSTTATQLAVPPQQGCIDIARSSSAPGGNASTSGQLIYIPFALDAVTGATGPSTAGTIGGVNAVATQITTADSFTLADLVNLYKNCATVTEGGVTYNPGTAGAGQVQINLYIPQAGSGTRSFWANTLNFSNTAPPACVHDTMVAGADTGLPVEEHDGTAVATDPNGYGPFSIAQWISQRNGHNDRRHGAVVHNIGGTSPFSNGNPATGALNTAFPITREVYNVVQYDRVVNTGDGKFDAGLAAMLAGTNSSLCQDSFHIQNYGFALLGASTTDTCGSTASSLRAFATL
jgi:phosphate transport system substrate-binding protein